MTARLIGVRELFKHYGLGRSPSAFKQWLKREERAGRFPKRLRLSQRVLAWDAEAVAEWERARREARRSGEAAA